MDLYIIGEILLIALNIYLYVLFARMVLSWVPLLAPDWRPKGLVLVVFETIYTLTDPPLKFVGRFIKPVRIGSIGLDIGFLVVVFAVIIAQRLVWYVF
ncbi:YggT family protein [Propionibacterium cyclohexanicum]|uniref:YggT family protein n=1 Tax=Propionibacterium cyclohexanicum TaxID=64702 RepID=A0A1H9PKT8_9ACTN|nr:YggT family protein [Propionibacterium cyclohexanicum]SER48445.1 YggT family protein [Propionibacterium cyclohexanicum]